MEEEGVIGSGVLDEPMHCAQNVLFCWLTHRILLVVSQNDHIISLVSEVLVQKCRHVLHIIDATTQLTSLSKVVDADQKSFPPPCTVRILESISLRSASAKRLHLRRRWRRGLWIAIDIGI